METFQNNAVCDHWNHYSHYIDTNLAGFVLLSVWFGLFETGSHCGALTDWELTV